MTVLYPEVIKKVEEVKQADLVIGIPSFRSEKTISHVIRTSAAGAVKYFPFLKPIIVNADGGSTDNTREVVLKTPLPQGFEKIVTPYRGLPGKGSAFHTIFEIADRLKAKVCIVLDSDLRSITPEWIKLLGEPVYKYNYGFVTPYYLRYKYDGTITNSIVYPLTRALYGFRVRQPIGGDFAFSGALAKVYSHLDVWETDIARFGIDIWMTTVALNEGFRIAQAGVGVKLHDPKDPASDLVPMFKQVVGTVFSLMREYEMKWKAVEGSHPVDVFGKAVYAEPHGKDISLERLISRFKEDFESQKKVLEQVLTRKNFRQVLSLLKLSNESFYFPEDVWVKVIYDFAIGYNFSCLPQEKVLEALVPLYLARTASFINETKLISSILTESLIEGHAIIFERFKPYLIRHWDQAKEAWQRFKEE